MRALENILWRFPFLGFVNAIATYLLRLLLLVTIVVAPIGRGLMEFGRLPTAVPWSKNPNCGRDKGPWPATKSGGPIRVSYPLFTSWSSESP